MPKPHLVFVIPALFQTSSGLTTYYVNLFRWLSRWQYTISLIVAGDSKTHELSGAFQQVVGITPPVTFIPCVECEDGSTLPIDGNLAIQTIRRLKPDTVWCTENSLFIVEALARVCDELHCPLVCRLHQSLQTFFRRSAKCYHSGLHPTLLRILPLLFSSCTMVMTSDLMLARNFQATHWKPRRELRLQITPIDEPVFKPRSQAPSADSAQAKEAARVWKQILARGSGTASAWTTQTVEQVSEQLYRQYWLFVGKLTEDEGVKRLPLIWNLLMQLAGSKHELIPPLIIVGEGPLLETLQNCRPFALTHWYFYPRHAKRRLLAKLYQNAAGLLTTHTQPSFGYMSLEAALCACPLLTAVPSSVPLRKSPFDAMDETVRSTTSTVASSSSSTRQEEEESRDNSAESVEEPGLRPLSFTMNAAYRLWHTETECAQWIRERAKWTTLAARMTLHKEVNMYQDRHLHLTALLFQQLVHLGEY